MTMPTLVPERLRRVAGEQLRRNEPLARHTSFRIGGPADYLVVVEHVPQLVELVQAAEAEGIPWLVLGRGSNVLVADRGFRGLVIRNLCAGLMIAADGRVRAESGVRFAHLATQVAKAGWGGLEYGIGIPGSVGGAVVMNAGAHGGSFGDYLVAAEVLRPDGEITRLERADLQLGYRSSRFHHDRKLVVLAAELALPPTDPAVALARIRECRERRQATQPTAPGAGSIFKNPPEGTPAAGWLIDQAGLKGTRRGDAIISPKHGNFIVNLGQATAADVMALVELAQATVYERFGIRLELEIERVGAWTEDGDG